MRKLVFLFLLMPFLIIAQDNDSFLLTLSEITVKPGHDAQFIAGVKAWKDCYLKNEGNDKWNIWKRVQGEGSVYTITGRMANWAEMDEQGDEAGKACRMLAVNLIMPHVKSSHYNIARFIPNTSRSAAFSADTEVVWVANFKTKNSRDFRECVNEISSVMETTEGDNRGYWYAVMGGSPEVADYFVSIPYKNFAELDVERDGVWKVYENEHGKEKTDALRDKFRASVSKDWSYMYTLNKKLSN
ncbi:hypothetical protein [Hyunsoonleella aestuarii]|nr:hypothetical protein [Hyunsoonleella aestuarii]